MKTLLRLLPDRRATSAVEFGFIAPVLAFAFLGLADGANKISAYTAMQRAARAGVQYFLNGGTDTTAANAIVTQAWTNAPSNGTVNIAETCQCGASGATCGSTCSGGITMTKTLAVTVSGTVHGMLGSLSESAVENVRIQ
jgi:Flp pilus assembly protein TadG